MKIPTPAPENSIGGGKLSRPQPHFLPQQVQYRQPSRPQQAQQIRQPIQVEPQYE